MKAKCPHCRRPLPPARMSAAEALQIWQAIAQRGVCITLSGARAYISNGRLTRREAAAVRRVVEWVNQGDAPRG